MKCQFVFAYGVPLVRGDAGDGGFAGKVFWLLSRAAASISCLYRSFAEISSRCSVHSSAMSHPDGGCFPESPGTCLRVHVFARGKAFAYGFPRAQEGLLTGFRRAFLPGIKQAKARDKVSILVPSGQGVSHALCRALLTYLSRSMVRVDRLLASRPCVQQCKW